MVGLAAIEDPPVGRSRSFFGTAIGPDDHKPLVDPDDLSTMRAVLWGQLAGHL